jgi:REP element-mobilizing transposase RayT
MARTTGTGRPFTSELLADFAIGVPKAIDYLPAMPRRRRPYLPGAIFHLTARTRGREHWFDPPVRDLIRDAMRIVQQHTDAKLRAYVIMSNHVHVLLQQGRAPLAAFMQPLLCRVALAVRKKYSVDERVFGRPYWDEPIADELHLRTIVGYIHSNPLRAGLCADLGEWPWSSHECYLHPAGTHAPVVEPLFVATSLSSAIGALAFAPPDDAGRLDLRDILTFGLHELTNGELTLFELRLSRSREAARLRRALIRRAAYSGYRGSSIADALGVSESLVSRVARAARIARPRFIGV